MNGWEFASGVLITAIGGFLSILAAREQRMKREPPAPTGDAPAPTESDPPAPAAPDPPEPAQSVTNEMIREAQDPGVLALQVARATQQQLQHTNRRLTETEAKLARTEKRLHSTQQRLEEAHRDLEEMGERVDELAQQNRRLRGVLRELVVRMERLAEWYRAGSQGEPPDSLEQIIRDALEAIPDLRDEETADA